MVADRRAANNRTQWAGGWAWEHGLGFLDAILTATVFASWLVEPGAHESLPPLVKVGIWNHLIALHLELIVVTKMKEGEVISYIENCCHRIDSELSIGQ